MARKNKSSDLFNLNGCLNQSTIARFIDKRLDEQEHRKVISHLEACPLCKDAVEGISGIGNDQFNEDMKRLRTDFFATSSDKDKNQRLRLIRVLSAAASVIIVFGVLFYYFRTRMNMEGNIAQSVETSEKAKTPAQPAEESVPLNEAARPVQVERDQTPEPSTLSMDIEPLSDVSKDQVMDSEAGQGTVAMDAALPDFAREAEPVPEEKSMELAEEQSVKVDMSLSSAAADRKRAKSVMNTGMMQEGAKPEAKSTLAAGHVIYVSDEKPSFKGGGISEFVSYLQDQVDHSDQLLKKTDTDSIFISFVIDTLGKPVNIKLINQTDPEIKNEIIRLFRSSPDWLPGKENGVRINVGYTIAIRTHPENQ